MLIAPEVCKIKHSESRSPRVVPHRCAGLGKRENSISALKRALGLGFSEMELDVRLTRDRRPVFCHMPWYKANAVRLRVLSKVEFSKAENEGIDSLEEGLRYFKSANKTSRLVLDIKETDAVDPSIELIKREKLENRVSVISWRDRVLYRVGEQSSDIPLGYSFMPEIQSRRNPLTLFLKRVEHLVSSGLAIKRVVLVPLFSPPPIPYVKRLTGEFGIGVFLVGIDSMGELIKAMDLDLEGVFSKKPLEISEFFRSRDRLPDYARFLDWQGSEVSYNHNS